MIAAISLFGSIGHAHWAQAQIVPDQDMGDEASTVMHDVMVRGDLADLIEGGTVRGENLFHSFTEFNIGEGQRVYFASPEGIDIILSQVMGENPSNLLGTLGVDGAADLFLVNPNGIVFGENASLDVGGSFYATTVAVLPINDEAFNTATAQGTPLLTVSSAALSLNRLTATSGDITNHADLAVDPGQTLTLLGSAVLSEGRLAAPGGTVQVLGDRVGLTAAAVVDVADTTAGGTVLIGGDLQGQGTVPLATRTFVGPGVTIQADALTRGNGGQVVVWSDEVTGFYGTVSARGAGAADTSLSSQGGLVEVSSHGHLIFRGAVDTASPLGQPGLLLLDPTTITIANGTADGATDGTDSFAGESSNLIGQVLSTPLSTVNDRAPTTIYESELEGLTGSTDVILQATDGITLEDLTDDGLQFAAGTGRIELIGDADKDGVGNITMVDSQDELFAGGRDVTITGADIVLGGINTTSPIQGGNITIASTNGVITLNGSVDTGSFSPMGIDRNGGNITIRSVDGDISINNELASGSGSREGVAGRGGDIAITSVGGAIAVNRSLTTNSFSRMGTAGQSGNITLASEAGDILVNDEMSVASSSQSGSAGEGGDITLTTEGGDVVITGPLSAAATSNSGTGGSGGNISISSNGSQIAIEGAVSAGSFSQSGTAGSSGNINIIAENGSITTSGELTTSSVSLLGMAGVGGDIIIRSTEGDITANNNLSSVSFSREGAVGMGGDITLVTRDGNIVTNGELVASSVSRSGTATTSGNITLTSRDGNILTNRRLATDSVVTSAASSGSAGTGGDITLTTNSGSITTRDELRSGSFSSAGTAGAGGAITIRSMNGNITTDGELASGSTSRDGQVATGGDITIASKAGSILLNGPLTSITSSRLQAADAAGDITIRSTGGSITANNSLIASSFSRENSASAGGNITLQSEQGDIIVSDELDSQSVSITGNADNAGDITIEAERGNISIGDRLNSQSVSIGGNASNGGDIAIASTTGNILTNADARVFSGAFSRLGTVGDGGDIVFTAPDGAITGENTRFLSFAVAATGGATGSGGNVALESDQVAGLEIITLASLGRSGDIAIHNLNDLQRLDNSLTINDLSLVTSGQFRIPFPDNPDGFITLDVDDFGQSGDTLIQSTGDIVLNNVDIQADANGSETAGGVTLMSPSQITFNNSQIRSNTNSDGDAGAILIEADSLSLGEGDRITAATTSAGNGGTITLDVADRLTIDGGIIRSSTDEASTGRGGSVRIPNTNETVLRNGSQITVDSDGEEPGGSVELAGDRLTLDNSRITATTRSSDGGDLTFSLSDLLQLRNGSLISTEAGTEQAGGNGGDVVIATDFVIAVPGENSDIIANAFNGTGGQIDITATTLLGLTAQSGLTTAELRANSSSDISASSQLGQAGSINLNTLVTDPTDGLTALPTDLDSAQPLAQSCLADSEGQSAFVITGRGGIAPDPSNVIRNEMIPLADFGSSPERDTPHRDPSSTHPLSNPSTYLPIHPPLLLEAQNWHRNAAGNIVLLAEAETATMVSALSDITRCGEQREHNSSQAWRRSL